MFALRVHMSTRIQPFVWSLPTFIYSTNSCHPSSLGSSSIHDARFQHREVNDTLGAVYRYQDFTFAVSYWALDTQEGVCRGSKVVLEEVLGV